MRPTINLEDRAHQFLTKIFQNLKKQKIDITKWEIDHLCYRTSSEQNYFQTKKNFQNLGRLLVEGPVNGRLISTYKLHRPIFFKKWVIHLVEVPAPKKSKMTPEGFEHIEVVIDESFDELIKRFPHIVFDEKGRYKDLNPDIEVEFDDCAIKFHHHSLDYIINLEKNLFLKNRNNTTS